MRKIVLLLLLVFPCFQKEIKAQQRAIEYDRNFVFRDGIYLSFQDFRNNAPIPVNRVISDYNRNVQDFLGRVLSKKSFSYIDVAGSQQTANSDEVWGYCSGGMIYINYGTDFNRMTVIGSISHFIATLRTRMVSQDPFYYGRPYGYGYGYGYPPPTQFSYTSVQCILDFDTGNIMDFNINNMEIILSRDPMLYQEFLALKKRRKKEAIFYYLRKYNEKHPIYFPE